MVVLMGVRDKFLDLDPDSDHWINLFDCPL